MANLTDQNPIIIDTPGAGIILSKDIDVYLIRWVSPAAVAGHQCVIQDANSINKWESVANGANYVEADHIDTEGGWRGLVVPTLSSGKLYIYLH